MTPETCPNCGADVPRNAKACPECGSCEETGWSEQADTQDLGLPGELFDYDDFAAREFGQSKRTERRRSATWLWWGIAILLGAGILGLLLR